MNSCLYQGVLRHRRLQPKAHHFVYRLFIGLARPRRTGQAA
ncbi:DUF1365 family protein [Klebsiella variicola]|nr:DUF1365 family protein [Klebsiella variicola]